MKKIILMTMLASATAFAAFPIIKVDSISGSYEDKKGKAFAQYASYDLEVVKVEHSELEVNFNNVDKNLVINDLNTSVRLKIDFSFLNVFKSLSFDGVNVRSTPRQFHTNLGELRLFIDPSEYVLENVQISSDLTQTDVDIDEVTVLEGFILNGDISVEEIRMESPQLASFRKDLAATLPDVVEKLANKIKNADIPVVGRNLRLVAKESTFSGSVLLDSWINAWLYLGGKLEHDKENNELKIDLLKAKLGIFSVRGFLLKTIRNLNLETVKVEGHTIIVNLDQVAASGQASSR